VTLGFEFWTKTTQHLTKSSRAISRVTCLYETDVSRTISVPDDGERNVGVTQTRDAADSPRRIIRIYSPLKLQIT